MNRIRKILMQIPRTRWKKQSFLLKIKNKDAKILDVGCGNNSPAFTKQLCPNSYYVGVDVGNYNNTQESLENADEYVIFKPEEFAQGIAGMGRRFDAVISSHNLEHCNNPEKTLDAMCSVLKINGLLYLAFPNEDSIHFPSREGTLNFYDDPTHIYLPKIKEVKKY